MHRTSRMQDEWNRTLYPPTWTSGISVGLGLHPSDLLSWTSQSPGWTRELRRCSSSILKYSWTTNTLGFFTLITGLIPSSFFGIRKRLERKESSHSSRGTRTFDCRTLEVVWVIQIWTTQHTQANVWMGAVYWEGILGQFAPGLDQS